MSIFVLKSRAASFDLLLQFRCFTVSSETDSVAPPQNIDDFINQFVVNNSHTSVFLSLIQFKIEHLIVK